MVTRFQNLTVALLATISVAGCSIAQNGPQNYYDVSAAHPIIVDAETASYALHLPAGASKLSSEMEAELRAFLAGYRVRGHGPLTIAPPKGAGNTQAAQKIATQVERLALASGIAAADVAVIPYNVSSAEPAPPVLLSFTRYVASATECGDWSRNYAYDPRNVPVPNFGCATQNNLAAMLDDPHDLIAPRDMGSSDAERRATVFDKYRKGEPTAAKKQPSEEASVSKVGQ